MKNKNIFIFIFVAALFLILNFAPVQAETKEFYFPIEIESRQDSFNPLSWLIQKAEAVQMSLAGQVLSLSDGGGEAEDKYFSVDLPGKEFLVVNDISNFIRKDCPSAKKGGECYDSISAKQFIHPWRVIKSDVYTVSTEDINSGSQDCKVQAYITSTSISCENAAKGGIFYGAADGLCRQGSSLQSLVSASLDEGNFSDSPASRACGHIRLDGGKLFDLTQWRGYLKATAKSPSFDKFVVSGIDAKTGKTKTVGAGEILNVCSNNKDVTVSWKVSDVQKNYLVYGGVNPTTCGGCVSGVPKEVPFSGSTTVTPINSASFSLVVKAATGDGPLNLSPESIYVAVEDCAPPIKEHCDSALNVADGPKIGENPYCLALYDTPKYGSTKKCCNWPDNVGEFGDGCGKCGGESVPPQEEIGVDLKVNGQEEDVITINSGDSISLSWETTGSPTDCSAFDSELIWAGSKPSKGSEVFNNITSERHFLMVCTKSVQRKADEITVFIVGAPKESVDGEVDLRVNGKNTTKVNYGDSVNLSWTSSNVKDCRASMGWNGSQSVEGSSTVSNITKTTFFELTCIDSDGKEIKDMVSATVDQPGNINVKIRLDGKVVSSGDAVSYTISGPQPQIAGTGNKVFGGVKKGNYIITYTSGYPKISSLLISSAQAQTEENNSAIVFTGYSPARSLLVKSNKTTVFYLDFSTILTCDLRVEAECDGSAWTGPLSYALLGAVNLNGTAVPQEFNGVPAVEYYLSDLMSGPGSFDGITPSNPFTCLAGEEMVVNMKFQACGGGQNFRYKCNLQSGRCEICNGDDNECPYNNLNYCRQDCSGINCNAEPEVNCWTNYNSEECIGLIDQDSTSPNVVLTNQLAGCQNVSSCKWEIEGYPQYTQNSCAPFSWYDDPGSYIAKLTVVDDNGSSATDTQDFEVRDIDGVICDFVWSPTTPTLSSEVSFFDRSLTKQGEEVTTWNWTISGGDPATSTVANIAGVSFNSVGNHTVTLRATTNQGNTCNLSKEINIRQVNPKWWEVVPK